MNDITFSPAAVDLLARFEGFRPCPYSDSGGVATIGYGTTFYEDGTAVTLGDTCIDQARAKDILLNYLNVIVLPDFRKHISVDLTQNQIDALCCLVYNIGGNGFDHSSVLANINQHIMDGVLKDNWLAWNKVNHVVNQGLVNRRTMEYNYFQTGSIS